jgi:light-regulated signal transduction histidine kinase (bacteriophytochrome)
VRARDEVEARSEEMARLARSLARSNRELEQFAYIAAHDLKSPLRGIANLSEWIEEDLAGAMNPTTQRQMELLRGRVHRMEELIDGIRDYTRAGSEGTDAEEVDTAALVREVGGILELPGDADLQVTADMPVVRTNRAALRQVFLHLLDNARIHGRPAEGAVRIRVEARREGAFWEFRIEDNGPGIPPEYREKAWTIFQTLRRRDHFEGAGIGLPLVKKIVEQHGGSVGIETASEGGTIVRFTWAERTR